MEDKSAAELERFEAEQQLEKATAKLHDERQTATCGPIGCGAGFVVVIILLFIFLGPTAGVIALVVSTLIMVVGWDSRRPATWLAASFWPSGASLAQWQWRC